MSSEETTALVSAAGLMDPDDLPDCPAGGPGDVTDPGTDPTDPASLFRPKILADGTVITPVTAAKPTKVDSDALFIKKHMPRLVRRRYATGRKAPRVADIQRELDGLTKEFGGFTLCRENKTKAFCDGPYLSVKTDPITLEDEHGTEWELGEFEVYINLQVAQQSRDATHCLIGAFALQPNPSDKNEDTTHPHVQGNDICFGDGALAVDRALRDCRFADAFTLVNQILHTYNRESPYAQLETWDDYSDGDSSDVDDDEDEDTSRACIDCDDSTYDDCQACSTAVCDDCVHRCTVPGCRRGTYYCPTCATSRAGRFVKCADCGDTPAGERVCLSCRYYIPGTNPPQYRCDHCNARAILSGRPTTDTPGTYHGELPTPGVVYVAVPPPARPGGVPADAPDTLTAATAVAVDAPARPQIGSGGEPDLPFGAPDAADDFAIDLSDAAAEHGVADPGDDLGDDRTTRGWGAPAR